VTTHVPSSLVEAKLPAKCGIDTLTTVVSRTSMKVASITAKVTTHGFTMRCGWLPTGLISGGRFPPCRLFTIEEAQNSRRDSGHTRT